MLASISRDVLVGGRGEIISPMSLISHILN